MSDDIVVTFNMPFGSHVSVRAEANNSTTIIYRDWMGNTSHWNSGVFLACSTTTTGTGMMLIIARAHPLLTAITAFLVSNGCEYVGYKQFNENGGGGSVGSGGDSGGIDPGTPGGGQVDPPQTNPKTPNVEVIPVPPITLPPPGPPIITNPQALPDSSLARASALYLEEMDSFLRIQDPASEEFDLLMQRIVEQLQVPLEQPDRQKADAHGQESEIQDEPVQSDENSDRAHGDNGKEPQAASPNEEAESGENGGIEENRDADGGQQLKGSQAKLELQVQEDNHGEKDPQPSSMETEAPQPETDRAKRDEDSRPNSQPAREAPTGNVKASGDMIPADLPFEEIAIIGIAEMI